MSEEEMERYHAVLDRELGKFAPGEEYSYVKDMSKAYAKGLATSEAEKIFKTIPDHVFWDIKKPLVAEERVNRNPYNPARNYPNHDFFDTRSQEQWLKSKNE